MDEKTAQYYNNNAREITDLYNSVESPFESLFPLLFKRGDRVLDVGCGSGRDLSMLLESGYDAYGMEPSDSLRELAVEQNPKIDGRIFKGSLPEQVGKITGEFDHILLAAVIMHIPDNKLFETVYALRKLLKKDGLLIVSHCLSRENPLLDNRDETGRLYILRSSDQIQLLFEELGFQKRHCFRSNDKLNRSRTAWETLVFEYSGEGRSESVDQNSAH